MTFNDESGRHSRSHRNEILDDLLADATTGAGRWPVPALQLHVTLEGSPTASVWAGTWEQEQRLRLWLRSPVTRARLAASICRQLRSLAA